MSPTKQVDEPRMRDARHLGLPLAQIAAIIGATAWAVWVLKGEAQTLGVRLVRVEYAMEVTGAKIDALTSAVDKGISTTQADAWIRLFRANLQAVEPKLVPTVPDLPPR